MRYTSPLSITNTVAGRCKFKTFFVVHLLRACTHYRARTPCYTEKVWITVLLTGVKSQREPLCGPQLENINPLFNYIFISVAWLCYLTVFFYHTPQQKTIGMDLWRNSGKPLHFSCQVLSMSTRKRN